MENVVQLFVPGAAKQPCNIPQNKQLRPAIQTDLKATSKKGVKTLFQINFAFQGKPRFKSWQDGHVEFFFLLSIVLLLVVFSWNTKDYVNCWVLSSLFLSRQFLISVPHSYKILLRLCITFIHTLFFTHFRSRLPWVALYFFLYKKVYRSSERSRFSPVFVASSKNNNNKKNNQV